MSKVSGMSQVVIRLRPRSLHRCAVWLGETRPARRARALIAWSHQACMARMGKHWGCMGADGRYIIGDSQQLTPHTTACV